MFSAVALVIALAGMSERRPIPAGMVVVPGGTYTPLYRAQGTEPTQVRSFALDRLPVTRGQFLVFVQHHAEWRRGTVRETLAADSYLSEWSSDLDAGSTSERSLPVVDVSWFAAKAFCEAQGKRLPTTAEWERAAAASDRRQVLAQYASRGGGSLTRVGQSHPNALGIFNLHDLVWEWTLDFNPGSNATHAHHAGPASDAHADHASCASAAIGASTTSDYPAFLRQALRSSLRSTSTTRSLGFRCAAGVAA